MDISRLFRKFSKIIIRLIRSAIWDLRTVLFGRGLIRSVLADGSVICHPAGTSIAKMLFVGNFETAEISFVRNSLKPGDIFLDVGANVGIYTLIASRLVGAAGHVYAFEPSRREANLLRHNIALARLENVTVIEAALSDRSGTARLAIADDGGLNSFADTHRADRRIESWQEVETIRLDDFVRNYAVEKVDFIKMDVEGAEKLVLEGADQLLRSGSTTVLFESTELNTAGFGYTVQDFLKQLLDRSMSLFVLGERGAIRPVSEFDPAYGRRISSFVIKSARPSAPWSSA